MHFLSFLNIDVAQAIELLPYERQGPGPRLNIKTVFLRYGDSHVKDKTVGETVLSLAWESLCW